MVRFRIIINAMSYERGVNQLKQKIQEKLVAKLVEAIIM
jgi:hypothetical protein